MKRTFLDKRLFVPAAGIAWLVVGFYGTLMAVGLIFSFWYMGDGFGVALLGACLPIWFARQLLVRQSASWTAVAAAYGLLLGVSLLVFAPMVGGSRGVGGVDGVAALVPGLLSAVALWEMRRAPQPSPTPGPAPLPGPPR